MSVPCLRVERESNVKYICGSDSIIMFIDENAYGKILIPDILRGDIL